MGVSINLHVYKVDQLLNDIEEYLEHEGGRRPDSLPPRQWFMKVAESFGALENGKFFVVYNEYYEDYNPCSNFLQAVDKYYFPTRSEDEPPEEDGYWETFWSDSYETCSGGVNYLEALEILFEDEFGYEGKFNV